MSSPELAPEDFRYMRVGWFDQDRPCDKLVKHAVNLIPEAEGTLPQRWRWKDPEQFVAKYGKCMWASTASYHMLMFNGHHTFRVWTDSPKTCIVDVNPAIAATLVGLGHPVEKIPESTWRKTKPLKDRFRVTTEEGVEDLVAAMRTVYGLDHT